MNLSFFDVLLNGAGGQSLLSTAFLLDAAGRENRREPGGRRWAQGSLYLLLACWYQTPRPKSGHHPCNNSWCEIPALFPVQTQPGCTQPPTPTRRHRPPYPTNAHKVPTAAKARLLRGPSSKIPFFEPLGFDTPLTLSPMAPTPAAGAPSCSQYIWVSWGSPFPPVSFPNIKSLFKSTPTVDFFYVTGLPVRSSHFSREAKDLDYFAERTFSPKFLWGKNQHMSEDRTEP